MNKEKKTYSTYSNQKIEPLTIEGIKKMADMITKQKEKSLPRGLGWFTKLMAKFGWHRKYEIIVFDKSKFGFPYFYKCKDIELKPSLEGGLMGGGIIGE